MSHSKNGFAALELKRKIETSYKTAGKMKHKLIQVTTERDELKKLSGLIQNNDAELDPYLHRYEKNETTGQNSYFKWIIAIIGNVKSALTETYRTNRTGYVARYLVEYQYHINR